MPDLAAARNGHLVAPWPPAALFFYSPDRKGEHPQAHLKDFRGAAGIMTVMVPDLLEPTDDIRGLCTLIAADLHEVHLLITAR